MEAEEAVEVDGAAAPRTRLGDADRGSVVIVVAVAERDDDVDAVGAPAQEDAHQRIALGGGAPGGGDGAPGEPGRPGGGGVASADTTLQVVDSGGPFLVTSQPGGQTYVAGSTQQVTWEVRGPEDQGEQPRGLLVQIPGGDLAVGGTPLRDVVDQARAVGLVELPL